MVQWKVTLKETGLGGTHFPLNHDCVRNIHEKLTWNLDITQLTKGTSSGLHPPPWLWVPYLNLGGGFNHIYYFWPLFMEDVPFWRAYFSDGLKLNHQPGYFSGNLFELHPSSSGDLFARCVASFGYSQDPGDAIGGPCSNTGADDQWSTGCDLDVSKNSGTPKSSIFVRVFHYKSSILGYPYVWKHPFVILWGMKLETTQVITLQKIHGCSSATAITKMKGTWSGTKQTWSDMEPSRSSWGVYGIVINGCFQK